MLSFLTYLCGRCMSEAVGARQSLDGGPSAASQVEEQQYERKQNEQLGSDKGSRVEQAYEETMEVHRLYASYRVDELRELLAVRGVALGSGYTRKGRAHNIGHGQQPSRDARHRPAAD